MKTPSVEITRDGHGTILSVTIGGVKATNMSTSNRTVYGTKEFVIKLAKKREDENDPNWAGSSFKQNKREIAIWNKVKSLPVAKHFAAILEHSEDYTYILMRRVYGAEAHIHDTACKGLKAAIDKIEKKFVFTSEYQIYLTDRNDHGTFVFYDYGFINRH
jgi:hypothetical protein